MLLAVVREALQWARDGGSNSLTVDFAVMKGVQNHDRDCIIHTRIIHAGIHTCIIHAGSLGCTDQHIF